MKAIKSYRENKLMTQGELGQKVGVTQSAVSQWEQDISNPRLEMVPKLAEILGCTIEDLLASEMSTEHPA